MYIFLKNHWIRFLHFALPFLFYLNIDEHFSPHQSLQINQISIHPTDFVSIESVLGVRNPHLNLPRTSIN